jgi:recombination protein RecT
VSDYAEMARKTVVRRLCKYLPLSIEMAEALAIDEAAEGAGDVIDVPVEVPASSDKISGVKAKLAAKLGKPAPVEEETVVEPGSEHAEQEPEGDAFEQECGPESGEVRAPDQGAAKRVRR